MDKNQIANENLWDSARTGDERGLKLSLSALADIESTDTDGWTALIFAACHGRESCLALLIASGADLEAKDSQGWTSFMLACVNGHRACLGLLVAAGANVDAKDNDGQTAAMLASRYGHPGIAALIDRIILARKESAQLDLAAAAPRPGHRSRRV